jgi:hypothetical protein
VKATEAKLLELLKNAAQFLHAWLLPFSSLLVIAPPHPEVSGHELCVSVGWGADEFALARLVALAD